MAKKRKTKLLAFSPSESLVRDYGRQLRGLSKEIVRICTYLGTDTLTAPELFTRYLKVTHALESYSEIIAPWAETVSARVVGDVNKRNVRAWKSSSKAIGRQIGTGFNDPRVNAVIQSRIRENVRLITKIPREDAVEKLTKIKESISKALASGSRANVLASEIQEIGNFTASKAMTIARTEISKASTEITRVRAIGFGSSGYIWRTSGDDAVRPSHAEMEGKTVYWNDPPELDGMIGHAGEFPNDRCYPEVIIPANLVDEEESEGSIWQEFIKVGGAA